MPVPERRALLSVLYELLKTQKEEVVQGKSSLSRGGATIKVK